MLDRETPLITCVLAALLWVGATLVAQNNETAKQNDETVKKLFAIQLPNVPGNTLTAEVVEYPPRGKSGVHHHAGSVFAYVLTGSIRSQNSATGPARIYRAGESFFEPPGSDHLVSENASASGPASLLAVHVAPDGAVLTERGSAK